MCENTCTGGPGPEWAVALRIITLISKEIGERRLLHNEEFIIVRVIKSGRLTWVAHVGKIKVDGSCS